MVGTVKKKWYAVTSVWCYRDKQLCEADVGYHVSDVVNRVFNSNPNQIYILG